MGNIDKVVLKIKYVVGKYNCWGIILIKKKKIKILLWVVNKF